MSAAPTVPAAGEMPEMKPAAGDGKAGSPGFSLRDAAPPIVAILCLLGFATLIVYLIGRTVAATELEWTRAVYLLNGVEAVAFAAAGFLFGKEVHRQQAEKAEQQAAQATGRAQAAEAQAVSAEKSAATMRAKTDAIKAWADAKAAPRRQGSGSPSPIPEAPDTTPPAAVPRGAAPPPPAGPPVAQVDVAELQTMIHELFG